MELKKHYYLMISCPGDVIKERALLKECVETINNQLNDNSWVELIYWVTDTFSNAGMPAQESINEQIVAKSDGLIAIFNARLGTPVHEYPCGTDEEINLMLKANKHVSLLFNTHPQIDLTNPNSIEQITKLKEYKEKHSSNSFYKEFNDESSFKNVAMQEIRMWLRELVNSSENVVVLDGGSVGHNNSANDNNSKKNDKNEPQEIVSSQEDNEHIDLDAGPIDCVVYITNIANDLTATFNTYANLVQKFQVSSENFIQNLNFLHKQNNTQGIYALCKKYASDINAFSSNMKSLSDNFSTKWGQIFSYTKMFPYDAINPNDKIILKNSISTLKSKFDSAKTQANELVLAINNIPLLQKDLDKSLKALKNVFNDYSHALDIAIDNCEELESM